MSNILFDQHLLKISNISLDSGWTLFFYPEYASTILNEANCDIIESFKNQVSSFTKLAKNFRTQVHVNGVHLLVSVNDDLKEVRIATARLANEIFLLDQIESSLDEEVISLRDDNANYLNFKKHVQLINSVPISDHPGIIKLVGECGQLTSLEELESEDVLNRAKVITDNLLKNVESYRPIIFEKVSDFALSLTARFALLRIHLLKFIAILPSLDYDKSGVEVKRILLESLERLLIDSKKARVNNLKGEMAALPMFWYVLFFCAYFGAKVFPARPLAMLIRFAVRFMAKRFIAGENIELAQKNFAQLFATGRDVTLDQLGELVVSEKEADHYKSEVIKLVEGFSLHLNRGEKNGAGILKAHVSIKVSALCSDFKPEAFDYTYALVAPRLKEILLKAKLNEVFINIDAEHYHYRDVVFKIYRKVLLETEELRSFPHTGIVVQAYLRDAVFHLRDVVILAKERGMTMPVRLVKGAYWDAETVEANAHGHNAPEFLNKEETDIHFRQMVNEIFKSYPHIQICLASHNFSDHAFALALREAKYPQLPAIEHQCLHMTYEALSTAMAKMGWAVRNYVPIGSLIVGMAYLVRRIMENSSQVGVLTIMRSHKKKVNLLSPLTIFNSNIESNTLVFDQTITNLDGSFFNTPPLRTYLDEERASIENTLKDETGLGQHFRNKFVCNGEEVKIISPSNNKVVGILTFATIEDTDKALATVDKAFYEGTWSELDFSLKCLVMTKAALLMTLRRNELSRLIMHESGKSLSEALADVDEAIDFINFYIRDQKNVSDNADVVGRGPAAIIAPWNFPIAIPCGMVVSSLIAGNTVILKSAEQTPLIAQVLIDLLHEAGVDESSLIHLPGVGEIVGEKLINSPEISTIVFTGSKPVGVHIAKCAAKRLYINKKTDISYPVRVITEMGGKNAVIVTNNAELDETVSGILYSAFAHAGQKCSACSRVIVHNKVKEKLALRLSEAAQDLKVGCATDFSVFVNPLVNQDEKNRLIAQVKEASLEAEKFGGRVYLDRSNEELPGSCVGPVIIELPFNQAMKNSSFAMKELFAPVIHIIGYDTPEQAIKIFNGTEYGLTGGIFSQSQDDIDFYTQRMQCGNIYVNRPITGARVAIEPFGGFKLSGTGPKAGGVEYIKSLSILRHAVNAHEHTPIKQAFEKGSDYLVDFAKASGLYDSSRIERAIRSIDEIISNFGPLFPGVFGTEKAQLQALRQWLANDFQLIIDSPRDNRLIPGQLNYSYFDSFKSSCVYLSLGEKITINSFSNFIMAVACGLGVTVLCSNNKAYIWWKYLIDILIKNRFSPRNIECFYVNFDKIKKEENQVVDVFIVDGDDSSYLKAANYMDHFIGSSSMPRIIYGRDEVASTCFEQMRPYVNERSFAVNVMRHGAPMEVSLS